LVEGNFVIRTVLWITMYGSAGKDNTALFDKLIVPVGQLISYKKWSINNGAFPLG